MTDPSKPTPSAPVEGMPVGNGSGFDNERFPMALFPEERCQRNHGQSPARLAARGGLGWCEAAAIIEDRDWREMDAAEAERVVRNAADSLSAPSGSDLNEGVAQVREALMHAKATFYRYAKLHQAKGTDEGDEKACANAGMGEEMARAIEAFEVLVRSTPSSTLTPDGDLIERLEKIVKLYDDNGTSFDTTIWRADRDAIAKAVLLLKSPATPAIRDQALEEAARVANRRNSMTARNIADDIRALKGSSLTENGGNYGE